MSDTSQDETKATTPSAVYSPQTTSAEGPENLRGLFPENQSYFDNLVLADLHPYP